MKRFKPRISSHSNSADPAPADQAKSEGSDDTPVPNLPDPGKTASQNIAPAEQPVRTIPEAEEDTDPAYQLRAKLEVPEGTIPPRTYERALRRSMLFSSQFSGVAPSGEAALSPVSAGFEWLEELIELEYDELEVRRAYGGRSGEFSKALAGSPGQRQRLFETLEAYRFASTRSFLLGLWFDASTRPESGFWGGAGPSPDAYVHLSTQLASMRHTSLAGLPSYHIARGGMAYVAGNKAEAVLHYRAGAEATRRGVARLDQLLLGTFTAGSVEDFFLAQSEFTFPGWLSQVDHVREPERGDVLMLVGCDEVYFAAFAEDLVASAVENGMSADLHFHVYNPTHYTQALFETISARFQGFKLSLSTESFHIRDIRAAYTCIRYWRLPEFLDRWQRPILLVDADCRFTGDLAAHIDRGAHLGFRRFPQYPGIHPWRNLSANTFYARPTDEGKSFCRSLAKYLTYIFDPNSTANWWVDQNALSVAFDHYTTFSNRRWSLLNGPAANFMDLLHRKAGILDEARARIANFSASPR